MRVKKRERPPLPGRHLEGGARRDGAWTLPLKGWVTGVYRVVHQLSVACLEDRLFEAKACREPTEDFRIGQRITDRGNHRLGTLQPMVPVGTVQIITLQVRSGGQHDITPGHTFGHRDFTANEEDVVPRQSA